MSLLNTLLNPTFAPPLTFAPPITFPTYDLWKVISLILFTKGLSFSLSSTLHTLSLLHCPMKASCLPHQPLGPLTAGGIASVKKQELSDKRLQALPQLSRLKHSFSLWQGSQAEFGISRAPSNFLSLLKEERKKK